MTSPRHPFKPAHRHASSLSAMPPRPAGSPRPISAPLSRHSSLRSRPSRPSARAGSPAVSTVSPSRLPATDSVSYFPPFEDMGSICSEGQGSSSGQSEREKASERDREGDSRASAGSHRKRGSLGSIAEFVSASISWGLTPFACANTSQHPSYCRETSSPVPATPTTSEEAVEALSRKFTSSKQRVLEPFSVGPQTEDMVVREKEKVIKGMHKRRMMSECEVETMVAAIGHKVLEGKDDDESVVESLLDDVSHSFLHRTGLQAKMPATVRHHPRNRKRLPLIDGQSQPFKCPFPPFRSGDTRCPPHP